MGGGEEGLTRGDPLPKARRWGAVCGSRMGLSPMGLCWERSVWGALGGGRLHPAFCALGQVVPKASVSPR